MGVIAKNKNHTFTKKILICTKSHPKINKEFSADAIIVSNGPVQRFHNVSFKKMTEILDQML